MDDEGVPTGEETVVEPGKKTRTTKATTTAGPGEGDGGGDERKKFYVDGGQVEIAAQLVYELDPQGNQLRVVKYTDYTADKVRSLFPNAAELRKRWADADWSQ